MGWAYVLSAYFSVVCKYSQHFPDSPRMVHNSFFWQLLSIEIAPQNNDHVFVEFLPTIVFVIFYFLMLFVFVSPSFQDSPCLNKSWIRLSCYTFSPDQSQQTIMLASRSVKLKTSSTIVVII